MMVLFWAATCMQQKQTTVIAEGQHEGKEAWMGFDPHSLLNADNWIDGVCKVQPAAAKCPLSALRVKLTPFFALT